MMMRRMTRWTALLLTVILAAGVLVSCGGNSAPAADNDTPAVNEPAPAPAEPTPTPAPQVEPIYFPECTEECTKAKTFYGYYILQDSDVWFAVNEEETRFCVKFFGIGGRATILTGDITDGYLTVDPQCNGLFGDDLQLMWEDATTLEGLEWAPIKRN